MSPHAPYYSYHSVVKPCGRTTYVAVSCVTPPQPYEDIEGFQNEIKNWIHDMLAPEPPPALNPACQLRIKEVPEITGENAKQRILDLIKAKTRFELNPDKLVHAERFLRWENARGPRDIRVIFEDKYVRDSVYALRDYILNGKCLIIDELDEININIWRESVRIYGLGRVYTEEGKVIIWADNGFCFAVKSLTDVYNLAYCDGRNIFHI